VTNIIQILLTALQKTTSDEKSALPI